MKNESLMNQFLMRKMEYDDETLLLQELQENPMSEGQVKDMLTRGLHSDQATKQIKKFASILEDFRSRGLIVPDALPSFQEFVDSNPGIICIRKSTFNQMEMAEYSTFKTAIQGSTYEKSKQWKLYDDMPLQTEGQNDVSYVHHYKYNGKVSGFGWKVKTFTLDFNVSQEEVRKFNFAVSLYEDARKQIQAIFNDLEIETIPLELRGRGMTLRGIGQMVER